MHDGLSICSRTVMLPICIFGCKTLTVHQIYHHMDSSTVVRQLVTHITWPVISQSWKSVGQSSVTQPLHLVTRVYPKVSGLSHPNNNNNNKHSLRSNTKGYGGKTPQTN
jgi:hypothetical protein